MPLGRSGMAMIDSDDVESSDLIKTDVLGRRMTTASQREVILDEFERSGLSGPEFARTYGINYQTLATWRQKRNQQRSQKPGVCSSGEPASSSSMTLLEVALPSAPADEEEAEATSVPPPPKEGLLIGLAEGVRLELKEASSLDLALSFARAWNQGQGGNRC